VVARLCFYFEDVLAARIGIDLISLGCAQPYERWGSRPTSRHRWWVACSTRPADLRVGPLN